MLRRPSRITTENPRAIGSLRTFLCSTCLLRRNGRWILRMTLRWIGSSKQVRSASETKDWLLLHSVACASLTTHRLHESLSNSDRENDPFKSKAVPTFLAAEGEPLP